MLSTILIILTVLFLLVNVLSFFLEKSYRKSFYDSALLTKLFLILSGLTVGFACLYYLLSLEKPILKVNDPTDEVAEVTFLDALYFSGVTMLSVGYGDLVPIGSARFFSLVQAALGLLLPTVYFVKALTETNDKN
ncbi:two pore domain potassium channel family protein [Salipaludibacillus agaradhaerens]|uniref:Two pore domain potassium channel family protein n=1 Tax=Salipaludibacillus agaradhaerens TaxID=76935 RepID=A0A9Q4B423_SALAG|nr:potassium channel family protein [Salipaludibacillus agaradhaerens]MCR6097963.1 two pore domain potassium channel family protein [Salipaludibacillus agaradhaerens]MCR6116408.1 two pore domain potassium channel family protein [Salipaludibacillus agaradhaerens]